MGVFNIFSKLNINEGVKKFRQTPNAILLDVRTEEEYSETHIEGSTNLPLQKIEMATSIITDKNKPLFVYCRSGVRSAKAVAILKKMGYTNVNDIGGILDYREE
jgi:rhodanese-related sulfurtransferase